MIVCNNIQEYLGFYENNKQKNIGFVPTMGALHEGHIALVKQAKKENELVVVSIFVNPTQFAPGEDFDKYPRMLEKDMTLLVEAEVDVLFVPSANIMYSKPSFVHITLPDLANKLCGKSRPTHFQGVAIIVSKLFNIIRPTAAYFGQKDFQQTIIIKHLTNELFFPVKIVVVDTVRESDGLAKSSRNLLLETQHRANASFIYTFMQKCKECIKDGDAIDIYRQEFDTIIKTIEGGRLDYFEIVNQDSLLSLDHFDSKQKTIIVVAVYMGKVRLIDNLVL